MLTHTLTVNAVVFKNNVKIE